MTIRPMTCKAKIQGEKTGGRTVTCTRPRDHNGDHRGNSLDGSVFPWSDVLQKPEEVKFYPVPHLEHTTVCERCGALVWATTAEAHANWHIHVLKDGDAFKDFKEALSGQNVASAVEIPMSVSSPVAKRRTPETGIS